MPRLSHALILKSYSISSLLPLVLRGTRTLESAINELRWLKEHVLATSKSGQCRREERRRLLQLCLRRSRAEPLQYILESQPFGDLDIRCRPGVLIPRPETEAYTTHVAELILAGKLDKLMRSTGESAEPKHRLSEVLSPRILDVCSGSGCISLHLHSLLAKRFKDIRIVGLDISERAVGLANENLERNFETGTSLPGSSRGAESLQQVQFDICDILSQYHLGFDCFDIIISNPPYISKSKFATETTRSVRNYEPKLALVPSITNNYSVDDVHCQPEDIFYHRLLQLHHILSSKMLVMEIGDEEQARRVVQMALSTTQVAGFNTIEIWRDWPNQEPMPGEATKMHIEEQVEPTDIPVKGAGKIRTVVLLYGGNVCSS